MIHSAQSPLAAMSHVAAPQWRLPWLNLVIWWSGMVLELLILLRAFWGKTLLKYPVFYAFVASTFVPAIILYVQYALGDRATYVRVFLLQQFLVGMVLSCGVILEVLRSILPRGRKTDPLTILAWIGFGAAMFYLAAVYPFMATLVACIIIAEIFRYALTPDGNAERILRISRIVLFGAVVCCVAAYAHAATGVWHADRGAYEVVMRNFDAILAIFWLGIIGTLSYYGLPIGRNLKGIVVGCALVEGTDLIFYTIRCYAGPSFDGVWNILGPFSYLVSCVIWLVTLWTPDGAPAAVLPLPAAPARESSYYDDAKRMWGAIRAYLAKAAHP
jgi:hypothetical protein